MQASNLGIPILAEELEFQAANRKAA
jgi:hypothetical protein